MPQYQLEFHLPHFALRRGRHHHTEKTTKMFRDWIDLSFVARVLPDSESEETLGMYPAQISVTMCGTSERRYVVYRFEDNDFDPDREMGPGDFAVAGSHGQTDQITKDNDASMPIWDPRAYFLTTLANSMQYVMGEWTQVVRTIQRAFTSLTARQLSWTQSMLVLLRKLLPRITEVIDAWDRFISVNGDLHFFSDLISEPRGAEIDGKFHSIHEAVAELRVLQKSLKYIEKQCQKEERSLEIQLLLENNENANLMIVCICPVTVVSQLFAIPNLDLKFDRNGLSFAGFTILFMAIIQLLRLLMKGTSCQLEWWNKITSRIYTKRDPEDHRDIRRAGTHIENLP